MQPVVRCLHHNLIGDMGIRANAVIGDGPPSLKVETGTAMNTVLNVMIPCRIWIEMYDGGESDACDVIVEMENGVYFTAMFCTLPYLVRQMDLTYEVSKTLNDVPPARYAAFETPHVLVPSLDRDIIEDTIDNLLALDTFGTVFTQVTDEDDGDEPESQAATSSTTKRATAEVAAVVLTEVLKVDTV